MTQNNSTVTSHDNATSPADLAAELAQTRDELVALIAKAQNQELTAADLEQVNTRFRGLDSTLGLTFTKVTRDETRTKLVVGPQHHQPWGMANGGLLASIVESTASIAGVMAAGGPVVGVNNNTDFIRPVHNGEVEAVATPIQLGRRTQLWLIEIFQDDRLVARGNLRAMVMNA